MDHANGDYVACVDGDDYLERDMYEAMLEKLDDETDIVCCGTNHIFPAGMSSNSVQYETHKCLKYNNRDAVRELLSGKGISVSGCDKLYRRELFEGGTVSGRQDM